MKIIVPILTIVYNAIALVFGVASIALLGLAIVELWHAVSVGTAASLADRAAAAITRSSTT